MSEEIRYAMTNELKADLMLICGCLHDMKEQSKEMYIARYLGQVELRLENIIRKNMG